MSPELASLTGKSDVAVAVRRCLFALLMVAAANIAAYSQEQLFLLDGSAEPCMACSFDPENKVTTPTGDLVKVAQPTVADPRLDATAMLLGASTVRGNGLDNYLMMIMDKSTMAGRPIDVVLAGHGSAGRIQIGNTNLNAANKAAFVAGAKGKIRMLTLFGCCVASGTGPDFLQMLANDLMAPVKAYAATIGGAKGHPTIMDGFYVTGGNAALRTFNPVPEPASWLLLVCGLAMVYPRWSR